LDSQESIVVRINDRGPYVESRIIDLSYAAARQLGATDPGVIPVTIDVVEEAEPISARRALFEVQAGSFRDPDNARRTRDIMIQKFGAATIERSGVFWRVLVGSASPEAAAETLARDVRQSGQTFQSAFVVPAGR
jgi:rare lipoprotein A